MGQLYYSASMKKSWPIFVAICFLLSATSVSAQVKINEFSSATSNNDWVEIYNDSDEVIDLSTYSLTDGSPSGNQKNFSCHLAAHGFWVSDWGGSLNNDGDIIKLNNNGQIVDCVTYGDWKNPLCDGQTEATLPKLTIKDDIEELGARNKDGSNPWQVNSFNTKDAPNDRGIKNSSATCLSPSPSPNPNPSPAANSSPDSSTSSDSNQTPSPGMSPPPTSPSPTPSPPASPRIREIALLNRPTPEPVLGTASAQPAEDKPRPDKQLIIMLLATGTGLIAAAAIIIIKLWRKS